MSPVRSTTPSSKSERSSKNDDVATAVDAFRRILRELRRAARKTELATGLSAAQTFVLNAVSNTPACSLNDVAEMTLTDRTSVAAIVERLVDEKYLKRVRSDDDRRRASLTITARGQKAIGDAAPPPTKLLVDALRSISSTDRAALARGLVLLTSQMGIAHEPAGMLFDDDRQRRRAIKKR